MTNSLVPTDECSSRRLETSAHHHTLLYTGWAPGREHDSVFAIVGDLDAELGVNLCLELRSVV